MNTQASEPSTRPTSSGAGVDPAHGHYVELTPTTLQVARIESGSVVLSRNAALDNKAILDLLLNETAADWQENGWTASVATYLPSVSWHMVEAERVRALGSGATVGAVAESLEHGLSGDTIVAACGAANGSPVEAGSENKWLFAVAPAEGLAKLLAHTERCKIRAAATSPGVLDHVGAISRLLRVSGRGAVALWEPGVDRSTVFFVTAKGVEAVVPCTLKLTDVWETIRSELNLKYQLAAARLFYGDLFDFNDAAPRITAAIAPALAAALDSLPISGEKPALAVAGFTPTQGWLVHNLASALGTIAWGPDAETALGQFGVQPGGELSAANFTPATFGLLHRASAEAARTNVWQAPWHPTSTANFTITLPSAAKPVVVAKPAPAPVAKAPAPAPKPVVVIEPEPEPVAIVEETPVAEVADVAPEPVIEPEIEAVAEPEVKPVPVVVAPKPVPAPVTKAPTPAPAPKPAPAPAPVAKAPTPAPAPAKPAPTPAPVAKAPTPAPVAAKPAPTPAPVAKPAQPAPVAKAPTPAPAPAKPAPAPAPVAKAPEVKPAAPAPQAKPAPTPAPAAKPAQPAPVAKAAPAPVAKAPEAKPAPAPQPKAVEAKPAPVATVAAAPAAPAKKKSMGMIYGGIAAAVIIGAGAFYFINEGNKAEAARIKAEADRKAEVARIAEEKRLNDERIAKQLAQAQAEADRLRREAEAIRQAEIARSSQLADAQRMQREAEERLARAPGVIMVNSEPAGAEISIDGGTPQLSPAVITNVQPGLRKVTVKLPGYDTIEQLVETKGAQTTDMGVLRLQKEFGELMLRSNPSDSEYSVFSAESPDGAALRQGKAPARLDKLTPGDYIVKFTKQGLLPTTEHVTVKGHQTAEVNSVFMVGGVVISSLPAGATVTRNGKNIGVTPLTLSDVTPGDIAIELTLPQHESVRLNGKISDKETLRLHGEMLHVDRIAKPAEVKTPPQVLAKASPVLPEALLQQDGEVVISLVVGKDGLVRDLRVERTSNPALVDPCVKALEKWTFTPGKGLAGQALNLRLSIPFRFTAPKKAPTT